MRKQAYTVQWSIIVGVVLLLFTACSANTTPQTTYTYGNFTCPAGEQQNNTFITFSLHSNAPLRIEWHPQAGPLSTETTPVSVSLSAELVGPFSSLSAAQQISHRDAFHIGSPSVASLSPIHTDNWTNKTYVSAINLPPHLPSGYYVEFQRVENTNAQGTTRQAGACILNIVP